MRHGVEGPVAQVGAGAAACLQHRIEALRAAQQRVRRFDDGRVAVRRVRHLLVRACVRLQRREPELGVALKEVVGGVGLGDAAVLLAPDLRAHVARLRLERERLHRVAPRRLHREDFKRQRARRLRLERARDVEARAARRLRARHDRAAHLLAQRTGRVVAPRR